MKTAIVTGASRGIGRAIALGLAANGAQVVLCARDRELLESLAREIGNACPVALDLRLPDSPAKLVDAALEAFGGVDIVVNNAGATKRGEFETLTDDDWMDGYALKMFGAVRLTRAAWPHLRARAGSLINIAGSGGRTPGAQFTIGGSVNAALLSFTKAMADVGLRDGVQVNAINPGPVRTARLEKRLAQLAADKRIDAAAALDLFKREEKISKVGEPEDIAAMVAFILSDAGRLLHGSLIDMDGGLTKTM
ncbi:MAG TPA: SDR family oxidoreductase [Bryobacteraceae bacterium]|nr:SDR family oxidoreductase [Bryobacteraceae bacterium]